MSRHILIYFFSKGIPAIINLLAITVYTRLLIPDDYGIYSVVFVIVGLLNAVVFQWIRMSVNRYVQQYKQKENLPILQSNIFFSYIITVIIIIGAALLFVILDYEINSKLITLTLFLLILQGWYEINLALIRSSLNPVGYGILGSIKAILSFLLSILLISLGFGVEGLLIGILIGTCISLIYPTFKNWKNVSFKLINKGIIIDLFRYGFPFSFTFSLAYLINGTDRLLLGKFTDLYQTGIYSVSYDLGQRTLIMLMMVINLAAYPLIIKLLETKGISKAKKQLETNFNILLGVSIPAAVGMMILSNNISTVFLGKQYVEIASLLIPYIAILAFLHGIKSYYFDLAFQLSKRSSLQIIPVMFAGIINLILNIIWIPKMGIFGAAYAAIIAYGCSLLLSWYLGNKVFRLPLPLNQLIKIIIATLLMAFAILPLRHLEGYGYLIIQVMIGSLIYLISMGSFNYRMIITEIRKRFLRK